MANKNADLGAAVTVVIDEKTSKFALVLDQSKPEPHYWKFPGGKIEQVDIDKEHPFDDELTADNAATRETKEEVGIDVVIVERLKSIHKRTHTLYPRIGLGNFKKGIKTIGDEGELVKCFSLEELRALPNFMPYHMPLLQATLDFLGVTA